MPVVFIFIIALVVVAIGIGSARTRDALNRSWGSVAEQLGLSLTPAEWNRLPKLEGEVQGYPFVADIQKRGAGNHRTAWTRFRLGMPTLNLGLELKEEGFLSALAKSFGDGDIEVGDVTFDDRLLIRGRDAATIRTFLDPERRARIQGFFLSHRGAVINDQGITWARRGRISQSSQLLAIINEMLVVGRSLAPQAASPAVEPDPSWEMPPRSEPGTGVDPAGLSEPGPEPPATSEVVPEPDAGIESGAIDTAAPPSAPPTAPTVGIDEFCQAVFAPGALSFTAAQIFRERYQGQDVNWSGTLRSAVPYSFDFVFGSGSGIRAVVEVYRIDAATLGDGVVHAVVQLPADTEGLEARIGERLSFAGRLTKVDGLQRQVFVSGALPAGS